MSADTTLGKDKGFTHLHLHTQYSLLDGAIRMEDLAPSIEERGMASVAVTDHGNMYGAVDFYKRANKQKIKPIFGCEAYVASGDRMDKTKRDSAHMVLLAKDNEGYKNLTYLTSMGFMEGFYYNPRIDKELLRKHSKGIYALSACLGGVVAKPFHKGGDSAAAAVAKEYKDIFEPGHFFLEIQDNGYDVQYDYNQAILEIGRTYDIPMVATADAHYVSPEESAAHEVLMCIQQNSSIDEFRARFKHSDDLYIKTPQEMWNSFGNLCPEALENTMRISNSCDVQLDLGNTYLPNYGVPEGYDQATYLEKISFDGLRQRIKLANYPIDEKVYKERLEYELSVINKMDFPGYFLIVWDFIRYSKDNRIPVGPGRGSGAGSLVAYSLGITNIDPIPYGLIFERFLNPERKSMPDFDIDFCRDRRGEVINYVVDKYGKQNVGQIVTYAQLGGKSVIKDVGRVMQVPFHEINEITKLIPGLIDGKKVSIDKALEIEPKLREIQEEKPIYKDIIKIARALEGLNRQTGIHAAGVVIGDQDLWNYSPVCRGKQGEMVTQFSKDDVEEAGLVKFDFLGLKTLTVISGAIEHIHQAVGDGPMGPNKDFDIEAIPLTDDEVYRLIASANTDGVFQLESSGFKDLLKKLKPDCFEDIIAAVALYRPGPMDAGMTTDYVERKHGRQKVDYPHPVCEAILKNTYGVIVYQEQVMQIAVDLSGFTLGGADSLRKAMGKKKVDVMEKLGKQFIDGAFEKSGMDKQKAHDLFENIKKFAGYAFNKSHSAAYALISYQTAYLKKYYEVEFMAALLSTEMKQQDVVVQYIQSARENGIEVLSPDVNQSVNDFNVAFRERTDDNGNKVQKKVILFGLGGIKGVGSAAIESIIETRQQHENFGSIYGFCEKVDTRKVNRKVLEALVKSGAFDEFGKARSQLFSVVDKALEAGQRTQKDLQSGQTSLFGAFAAAAQEETGITSSSTVDEFYPAEEEWPEKMRLKLEKEALGFYISGHPLHRYMDDLGRLASVNTATIAAAAQGRGRFEGVTIAGIVSSMRERPLKNGTGRMAFVQLEDLHGSIEVLVFSKAFAVGEMTLKSGEPILIAGSPSLEGDEDPVVKVRAKEIFLLSDIRNEQTNSMEIQVNLSKLTTERLTKLKELFSSNRGPVETRIKVTEPGVSETVIQLPDSLRIQPNDELLNRVDRLFEGRVVKLS
ncbi:MAG: DNA polymerase III subunit alpha [Deltaproteobacteria bacterium]|nr:DNA polymerase III subunit alpha [Deltaproteobacteria bacterium]